MYSVFVLITSSKFYKAVYNDSACKAKPEFAFSNLAATSTLSLTIWVVRPWVRKPWVRFPS